jgi:hypothetical protein
MRFFPPAGGDRELDAQDFSPRAPRCGNSGDAIPISCKQEVVLISFKRNNLNREVFL